MAGVLVSNFLTRVRILWWKEPSNKESQKTGIDFGWLWTSCRPLASHWNIPHEKQENWTRWPLKSLVALKLSFHSKTLMKTKQIQIRFIHTETSCEEVRVRVLKMVMTEPPSSWWVECIGGERTGSFSFVGSTFPLPTTKRMLGPKHHN